MGHIAVVGAGLVGQRTARALSQQLPDYDGRRGAAHDVVLVAHSRAPEPCGDVVLARGWPHPAAVDAEVVVVATESAYQPALALQLLRGGAHVVTTADSPGDIDRLFALDPVAREYGKTLVVGAAYSPGVSTLLASYLARGLDSVTAISTAQFGTGGPACARQHHRAMGSAATEVHAGSLRGSRGGSGRELVWFPDPVGAADCYRAALADPFLLHQAFPTVSRIESRQAATRRDRLTSRLPMLRPPHAEGLIGAVWAEVRGTIDGRVEHRAMAATAAQATGAAAMAAAFCREILGEQGIRSGTQSAATTENIIPIMKLVSYDVRLWAYDGSQVVSTESGSGTINAARKWKIANENVAIATSE